MTAIISDKLVTVYGGSGFIGRHVVRALARRGWRIRVAVRRPDLAGHLQPMGVVGQIHAVQANLRYRDSVLRAAEGAHAVVNLAGILHPSGRQSFEAVHAFGARMVADAARDNGAALVHISALGADAESQSVYARTKAAGENAVRETVPGAVILRPSVVFGPEDHFFNRFAALARISPALPLIGGGRTLFQPVFVGDVAEAVAQVVDGRAKAKITYELGGPEVKSFRELMEYVLEVTRRKRMLVNLPFPVARFQAGFLQMLPKPLLTVDQVTLLKTDNVVSDEAIRQKRTLAGLGITPAAIGVIVPSYLYRFRKTGQFDQTREV